MIDQNILEMFYSANQQEKVISSGLVSEWNGMFFLNILDGKSWKVVYDAARSLFQRDSAGLIGQEAAFAKHLWFENFIFASSHVQRGAKRYIPRPKVLDKESKVVGKVPNLRVWKRSSEIRNAN
jgi:hypothetical protein